MVDREDADFHELALDDVRDDLAEVDLRQPGSAEPRAARRPQRELLRGLVAERQLAGDHLTEVAVALEATRDVGQELRGEVRLQVGVDAEVGAILVDLVAGLEAGEHLRAAGCLIAELVGAAAVDPGAGLTLGDLEALPAERGADRQVHRRREPEFELRRRVHTGPQLVPFQPTGEEARLVHQVIPGAGDAVRARCPKRVRAAREAQARTERRVERVPHIVLEVVVPERDADVYRPPSGQGPEATGGGVVDHIGVEFGQEAEWVDLRPVPAAVEVAAVAVPGPLAEAVPTEGIDLARLGLGERHPQVGHREDVFLQPVTPVVVRLIHRVLLGDDLSLVVDLVGDARASHLERVGPGPVGRLAVEELGEEPQRAAAQPDPPAAVHVHRRPVVVVVVGDVAAGGSVHEWGELPLLEDEIHHAGDGVGAVLGRGAVTQHLDAIDGARRDRVQVHAAGARPGTVGEGVDQGRLVPPLAVDQHQRVVGAQTPQRERAHDVGGVGDGLARKVDRGREPLQDLAGLRGAAL